MVEACLNSGVRRRAAVRQGRGAKSRRFLHQPREGHQRSGPCATHTQGIGSRYHPVVWRKRPTVTRLGETCSEHRAARVGVAVLKGGGREGLSHTIVVPRKGALKTDKGQSSAPRQAQRQQAEEGQLEHYGRGQWGAFGCGWR